MSVLNHRRKQQANSLQGFEANSTKLNMMNQTGNTTWSNQTATSQLIIPVNFGLKYRPPKIGLQYQIVA